MKCKHSEYISPERSDVFVYPNLSLSHGVYTKNLNRYQRNVFASANLFTAANSALLSAKMKFALSGGVGWAHD
jgi:hypothetical protein